METLPGPPHHPKSMLLRACLPLRAGEREAITLAKEKVRWVLPPEAAASGAASGDESESDSGSAALPPPRVPLRGRPPKRRLRGGALPEPQARPSRPYLWSHCNSSCTPFCQPIKIAAFARLGGYRLGHRP